MACCYSNSRCLVRRSPLLGLLMLVALPYTAFAADLDEVQGLMRKGQYQAVRDAASEVVQAGTWNQRWHRLLIDAQLTLGEYPEALATYQEAIQRFSTSLQLRMQGVEVYRFNGQADLAMAEQAQIFELLRSATLRYGGSENLVTAGRYFASRGEDGRKILELFYDRAVAADPKYVDAHLAIAELALSKNDFAVAAQSLERAANLDPNDPYIWFLTARAWSESDAERNANALQRALAINPQHIPTLLLQADRLIDREFYEQAEEVLRKIEQVNPRHPLMWAYRSVMFHLDGDISGQQQARSKALESWPQNPHVDHLVGRKLSQKYRFAEGAEAQRKALQFDPNFTDARFALAQDLLRLGDDQAGWELAEWAQREDGYNVVAFNLMSLKDRLSKFKILRQGNLLVRMDATEADIYGAAVLELLTEAEQALCEKYDVQPEGPIVVEIFPDQQDFAIRTFGLPGGAGFLGVCFGRVITANSPASQGETPSNWKSVLWHEFCHVVTLGKTNNRMPRWLSEGISVYEERRKDPTWGQRMNPTFKKMILGDDLTPISQLSGAFLSPKSPMHLQFAYFQSSLAVEFFVERYGLDQLRRVLVDLSVGMPINDSLERYAGSLQALDDEFMAFARASANAYGDKLDWSEQGLPETKAVDAWNAWLESHPDNYWGLRGLASAYVAENQFDKGAEVLEKVINLLGDSVDLDTLQSLIAIYGRIKNEPAELKMLEQLFELSADDLPQQRRLMEVYRQQENWEALYRVANRCLDINPLLAVVHENHVLAAEQMGTLELARESLGALAVMNPVDPAGIFYKTAVAYRQAEEVDQAKRFLLKALEEAPHYRDAQRMLLDLTDAKAIADE